MMTTAIANTTAITSAYVATVSTAVAQAYQYALDTNTVTFTGMPANCDVVILLAGSVNILTSVDSNQITSHIECEGFKGFVNGKLSSNIEL